MRVLSWKHRYAAVVSAMISLRTIENDGNPTALTLIGPPQYGRVFTTWREEKNRLRAEIACLSTQLLFAFGSFLAAVRDIKNRLCVAVFTPSARAHVRGAADEIKHWYLYEERKK